VLTPLVELVAAQAQAEPLSMGGVALSLFAGLMLTGDGALTFNPRRCA